MSYIKIHRKVLRSAIWSNINDWRLAETVLLLANWTPGEFHSRAGDVVKVGRGELVTSIPTLVRESGLSTKNVRTSLLHLEKCDFLACKATNHFRVIKIKKYNDYQGDDKATGGRQIGRHPAGTRQAPGSDIRSRKKLVKEGEEGARRAPPPRTLPNGRPDTIENRIAIMDPVNYDIEAHPSWSSLDFKVQRAYRDQERIAYEEAAVKRRDASPEWS